MTNEEELAAAFNDMMLHGRGAYRRVLREDGSTEIKRLSLDEMQALLDDDKAPVRLENGQ